MSSRKIKGRNTVLFVLAILAVLILLLPFAIDVFNAVKTDEAPDMEGKWETAINDGAELLTAAEETELLAAMKSISAWCPVAMETVTETGGLSTASYAELRFNQLFPQRNGILFLIDMYHRMLWIQKADANPRLTTEKCLSITDNVYRDASKGDYFNCAKNVFSQINLTMRGKSIPEPMKHLSNLFLAIGISLFAVFLFATRGSHVLSPKKVYSFGPKAERVFSFDHVQKSFLRYIVHDDSSSGSSGGGSRSGGGGGGGGGGGSSGGGHGF